MTFDTEKYLDELIKSIKEEKKINLEKAISHEARESLEVSATFTEGLKPKKEIEVISQNEIRDGSKIETSFALGEKSGPFIGGKFIPENKIGIIIAPPHMEIEKKGKKIEIPTFETKVSGLSIQAKATPPSKESDPILIGFKNLVKEGKVISLIQENEIRGNQVYSTVADYYRNEGAYASSVKFTDNLTTQVEDSFASVNKFYSLLRSNFTIDYKEDFKTTKKGEALIYSAKNESRGDPAYGGINKFEDSSKTKLEERENEDGEKYWIVVEQGKDIMKGRTFEEPEKGEKDMLRDFTPSAKSTDIVISGGGVITKYMDALPFFMSPTTLTSIAGGGTSAVFNNLKTIEFQLNPLTDKEVERMYANLFVKGSIVSSPRKPPELSLLSTLDFGSSVISDVLSLAGGGDFTSITNTLSNYSGFLRKDMGDRVVKRTMDINYGRGDLFVLKEFTGFEYDRDILTIKREVRTPTGTITPSKHSYERTNTFPYKAFSLEGIEKKKEELVDGYDRDFSTEEAQTLTSIASTEREIDTERFSEERNIESYRKRRPGADLYYFNRDLETQTIHKESKEHSGVEATTITNPKTLTKIAEELAKEKSEESFDEKRTIESYKKRKAGAELYDFDRDLTEQDIIVEDKEHGLVSKKITSPQTLYKSVLPKLYSYTDKYNLTNNQENIPNLGYVYVTPAFSDLLYGNSDFYKIPIQTNLSLTGDSITAEYNKIDFLNRVGSVAQYVRVESRTCEVTTNYFVETVGDTGYTMKQLQEIEYMYKSLIYPQSVKNSKGIYLSRPPVINIVYGYNEDSIETTTNGKIVFNKNGVINKNDIINNFFTNIRWEKNSEKSIPEDTGILFYRSYVVTGLQIDKREDDTTMFMVAKENGLNYPKDYSGFEITLTLLEIDPNYLGVNPVMNDYYNFSHRNYQAEEVKAPTGPIISTPRSR